MVVFGHRHDHRVKKRLTAVALIVSVMCLPACTPDPSRYVAQQQYDRLQAQLKDAQTKLDEAQKKLIQYEGHRYSLFNAGFRTFRTDSITGQTCIELASKADWKNKDVQSQSCVCVDYINDYTSPHNEEWRGRLKALCGF
jgi:hypothetical protein